MRSLDSARCCPRIVTMRRFIFNCVVILVTLLMVGAGYTAIFRRSHFYRFSAVYPLDVLLAFRRSRTMRWDMVSCDVRVFADRHGPVRPVKTRTWNLRDFNITIDRGGEFEHDPIAYRLIVHVRSWVLALLAAVVWPLFLRGCIRKRRRRLRARQGRCASCGYDLTGNESGVCPECGQPVESS